MHDDVVGRDHPEVAVLRVGRVDEEGRRAGRRERGGELARDVPGLADAADHDAAAAAVEDVDRADERVRQPRGQRVDRARLGGEHAARQRERAGGLDAGRRSGRRRSPPKYRERPAGRPGRHPAPVLTSAGVPRAGAPPDAMPQTLELILVLLAASVVVDRRLPAAAAAAGAGLPRRRPGGRPARARLVPGQPVDPLPGRVRHRLPVVLDRPRVQPAAAEGDAPGGLRARPRAGRDHDRGGDDRAAGRRPGLAVRSRPRRRARDELDRDRVEDAGRARRAGDAARPRRDGHPAVPGPRGGRLPDGDPLARPRGARARDRARRWPRSRRRPRSSSCSTPGSGRCAGGST